MSIEQTSQPTYNQLEEQFEHGHSAATVLVERDDGRITTAQTSGILKRDESGVENVTAAIDHKSDTRDGVRYRSHDTVSVPLAEMSDARQQELARKLAGTVLRGEMPRYSYDAQPASPVVSSEEHDKLNRRTNIVVVRGAQDKKPPRKGLFGR